MTANYDEIRRINIEDYGKRLDRWARRILDNLYSDQTHFIYELLQNAEDAKATKVRFHLHDDYLAFEHNGCPFSEQDVRAICGLADTDKDEDLTQIGRFGLGFKSVYAYTRTPEIHSESEHFVIEKYVQPHAIAEQHSELGTLFRFPFNHGDKTEESSHDEIASRLKDLGIRTLLFLKHLESVEYCIDGDSTGAYYRQIVEEYPGGFARKVSILGQVDEENEAEENWLMFKRDISALVPQEVANLSVEIAFLLSGAPSDQYPEFRLLTDSSLVVFFPTEKETGLGFLVQGPYRTTPARDNIPRDDEFNQTLVCETGELVVEALLWLREQDWLTVELLQTMPLAYKVREDYWDPSYRSLRSYFRTERLYDSFLEPVFEAFTQALLTEALIPSSGGGYVAAKDARFAGSVALRDLLDSSQLRELLDFDEDTQWISEEITSDSTQNLRRYLTTMLEVKVIDAEKFANAIDRNFLMEQTDGWIRQLYEYLPSGSSMRTLLRNKPIVRLDDGSHVSPFNDLGNLQAYLPTTHESRFPTVKTDVCSSNQARNFLVALGLKEPDIVDEVLTEILPKYDGDSEIDDDEHRQDLEVILQAMDVDSIQRRRRLEDALKGSAFLWATNTTGSSGFCKPGDLYFRSLELELYFEENSNAWFMAREYEQYRNEFLELGAAGEVRIQCQRPDRHGHVTLRNWHGWHVRGLHGFDPNWSVDGLELALMLPNSLRSEYIWNRILIPHNHLIKGDIESCTRQTFVGSTTETEVSKIGTLVREAAWLPNGLGGFVPPSELSLDDLPEDFRRDTDLAITLGMRTSFGDVIEELLNNDDIPESDIHLLEMLKNYTLEQREELLRNMLRDMGTKHTEGKGDRLITESDETTSRFHSAEREDQEPGDIIEESHTEHSETSGLFSDMDHPGKTQLSYDFIPPRPSPDTDFRERRTQEELDNAKANEPDKSERIRQVSRTEWECKDPQTRGFLYHQYGGHCQICGETFPKWDGEPYFEAIYLEPRTKARWLDRQGNSLCLCASHAAQFIQGAREFNPDFREQVLAYQSGEEHDVKLTLVGEHKTICFTQRHILDLKVILESEASDSS